MDLNGSFQHLMYTPGSEGRYLLTKEDCPGKYGHIHSQSLKNTTPGYFSMIKVAKESTFYVFLAHISTCSILKMVERCLQTPQHQKRSVFPLFLYFSIMFTCKTVVQGGEGHMNCSIINTSSHRKRVQSTHLQWRMDAASLTDQPLERRSLHLTLYTCLRLVVKT